MAKFKFDISLMGKQVVVTQVLERKIEGNNRFWESKEVEEKRVGWIIGHSWVCNGVYEGGSSYYCSYDAEYDYEPSCLCVESKTHCLLVTYWPNQKPVKIPVDGFVIYDNEFIEHTLLKPYSSSGWGSGKDREERLIRYKNFINEIGLDRDEKGRFIKC